MECAHCLRERSGAKSPPLAPIPKGETVCTSRALFLCRPPRASIARGPELDSLPSDHYETTLSLVTLWVKKRPLSCRPLRVRSLLVGSHSKTPWHSLCQVERLCLLPYDGVSQGLPREDSGHPLIWMNALRAPSPSIRSGVCLSSVAPVKGFLRGFPFHPFVRMKASPSSKLHQPYGHFRKRLRPQDETPPQAFFCGEVLNTRCPSPLLQPRKPNQPTPKEPGPG